MDPEPTDLSSGGASAPRSPPAQSAPEVQGVSAGGDTGIMSQDADVDMKDVELNELEPEKQPMNAAAAGGEKNGLVKIKVAEDEAEAEAGTKFTGLSKEELLKVAGSPGWVRTRWALLLLFWLGWLGMLAGAVVIIVRAPRCRELPVQRWWHKGALYRVADLQAFDKEAVGLEGVKGRLDYLSTLKVKGLVLGPIHKNLKDDVDGTDLKQIDSAVGSLEDFNNFLQSSKKKGMQVILDLTPNYQGQNAWFLPTQIDTVATKVKEALNYWLKVGVDGFQVRDVESLTNAASYLAEWQNITNSFNEDRLFIAGTNSSNLQEILSLLEYSKDLLVTSSYLSSSNVTGERTKFLVTQYLNATESQWCSWSVSQTGLMASFLPSNLLRLYQLLLFSLPGTPVFSSGDEIAPGVSFSTQDKNEDSGFLSQFRRLSDLRSKERSLLHGDFHPLSSAPGLFSYIRHWDQNERYLVVLNFEDMAQSARLGAANLPGGISLPGKADLLLSTKSGREEGTSLELGTLNLDPHEGLLLRFPYSA